MNTKTGAGREVVVDVREQLRAGKEPFSDIMAAAESCAVGDTLVLFATFKPVPLLMLLKGHGFEGETTKLGKGDWRVDFRRVRGPEPDSAGPESGGQVGPRPAPSAGMSASAPDANSDTTISSAGMHASAPKSGETTAGIHASESAPDTTDSGIPSQQDSTRIGIETEPGPALGQPAPEDVRLDHRGLEPPEPMVRTLEAIYNLQPGQRIVGKFDRTPMFLLPKLDDMGYTYEVEPEDDGRATVTIWHGSKSD